MSVLLLAAGGAGAAKQPTCRELNEMANASGSTAGLGPEELADAAGVPIHLARAWIEGRRASPPDEDGDRPADGTPNPYRLVVRYADGREREVSAIGEREARREAERLWQRDRHMGARKLASDAGVTPRQARDWIEEWLHEEEGDCKLYPDDPEARDSIGIAEFKKRLDDGRHEQERGVCSPRREACFYLVVDCQLPPRLRRIGRRMPSITPGRWVRTTAGRCFERKGRFRAVESSQDPASGVDGTSSWVRDAGAGKACAQNYLGEIYRRRGDYAAATAQTDLARIEYESARTWFGKAAGQANRKALINLGELHLKGLGTPHSPNDALACYRAARGDPSLHLAELPGDTPPGVRSAAIERGELRGPLIEIIDPFVSTRLSESEVGSGAKKRDLLGRLIAPAGIERFELFIDDQEPTDLEWSPNDLTFAFELPLVPLARTEFDFRLRVTDPQGKIDPLSFSLVRRDVAPPPDEVEERRGEYHALLIGIETYKNGTAWSKLQTPEDDVVALACELGRLEDVRSLECEPGSRRRWHFESIKVLTGGDATLAGILRELAAFRVDLRSQDSLLVFFAGHGSEISYGEEQDEREEWKEAYWIPQDACAKDDDQCKGEDDDEDVPAIPGAWLRTWLSSRQIAHQLETIRADRVLVVADSCFSGFLTRSTVPRKPRKPKATVPRKPQRSRKRSVSVLTSADDEEALDDAGRHSPFVQAVLEALMRAEGSLSAYDLHDRVVNGFVEYERDCSNKKWKGDFCAALSQYQQDPQFAGIRETGSEGGDGFVFIPVAP